MIVGCGVIGATIAYELSQSPDRAITVLDRNLPASGSTGAALGVAMAVMTPLLPQRLMTMTMTHKPVLPGPVGPLPKQGWRPGPFMTSSFVCVA